MTGTLNIDALAEPRGKLREGLSALRNFGELSRSLRVGPKALTSVLPLVAGGCAPLREAVLTLLAAVAPAFSEAGANLGLADPLTSRIDRLERELSTAAGRPLSARARLSLEQHASELSRELERVRGLLELLIEALSARPLRAFVAELVKQSVQTLEQRAGQSRIELVVPAPDFEATLRPRVVSALLITAVELVARQVAAPLRVELAAQDNGFSVLVRADPPKRAAADDDTSHSTLLCMRSALELSSGELSWRPENASLLLEFFGDHAMETHA
ncbi:MAG TPA: hypothetical protein VGI10_14985 [Polyangiaceae bacterium]